MTYWADCPSCEPCHDCDRGRRFRYRSVVVCETCGGTGRFCATAPTRVICTECEGTGHDPQAPLSYDGTKFNCLRCWGRGEQGHGGCARCAGGGRVTKISLAREATELLEVAGA